MGLRTVDNISAALTKDDSLILKGVAIILMLWHHLFYGRPEYGTWVYESAQVAKVCVALFLFLSGYGLAVKKNSHGIQIMNGGGGVINRLLKFYFNYWVVFLIFVPLGVFVFGRGLAEAYGVGGGMRFAFLGADFLGLLGTRSYNETWWFNQLIICLWIISPLLLWIVRRWPAATVVGLMLYTGAALLSVPVVGPWLLPFVLGMFWAGNSEKIGKVLNYGPKWLILSLITVYITICVMAREGVFGNSIYTGIRADGFLTGGIVTAYVFLKKRIGVLAEPLKLLGKHSMNMYLVHTFIFYYWFGNFVYSFRYPLLIFAVLLFISLGISVALEYLKRRINYYSFVNNILVKI